MNPDFDLPPIDEPAPPYPLTEQQSEACVQRGMAYRKQGAYDQAIAAFTEAISIDPKYCRAYYGRACVYRLIGKHQEAIADLNDAIRLAPDFMDAYYERGVNYYCMKRYLAAIKDLTVVTTSSPDAGAYQARGGAYLSVGDNASAVADFSESLRLNPHQPLVYSFRSFAHEKLGDFQKAKADKRHAARYDPRSGTPVLELLKDLGLSKWYIENASLCRSYGVGGLGIEMSNGINHLSHNRNPNRPVAMEISGSRVVVKLLLKDTLTDEDIAFARMIENFAVSNYRAES